VWSPDGSMIAFDAESWPYPPTTSQCGPVSPPELAECLGVVGSDGANAHVLLGSRHYYIYGDTARDDATLTASWTSDAANLVFAALSGEDPAPAMVQRVPVAGGLATTLVPGTEPAVGVAPAIVATALTVHVRGTTVTWDHADALSGTLTDPSKTGLPDQTVELFQRRHKGGTWTSVATTETGPTGDFTFLRRPHWNVDYQVRFAAPFHLSSKSPVVTVRVRPQVYVNLVPAEGTVRQGGHARVYGTVQPNVAGQPINLQRHTRKGWRTIQRHTTTAGNLLFNFRLPTSGVGMHTYRIVKPATAHRVRYASPRLVLTVTAD
jgi:hypothetical protein